ncbi:MAG: hypothetical protein M5U34_29530 [Chloroflexi bacterium]|nr:hypothetical protein [Chloroflexota bacterium]
MPWATPRLPPRQRSKPLKIGENLQSPGIILPCLQTLIFLAIEEGKQSHIDHYLTRLQTLINRLDKAKIELPTIGAGFVALGEFYNRLGRYDKVARPLLLAVRIFKKVRSAADGGQSIIFTGRIRPAARVTMIRLSRFIEKPWPSPQPLVT